MIVSFRPHPRIQAMLARLTRESGKTRSAVITEAIEELAGRKKERARNWRPYDDWKSVIGIIKGGPPDLSTHARKYILESLMKKRARNASR
ncbi:MAG: hypothetical protein FD180_916 [Planctomycetota bacterium]|nr:MAG: hypothetical protein FD180_916 [Planctomycetota bacterium]